MLGWYLGKKVLGMEANGGRREGREKASTSFGMPLDFVGKGRLCSSGSVEIFEGIIRS